MQCHAEWRDEGGHQIRSVSFSLRSQHTVGVHQTCWADLQKHRATNLFAATNCTTPACGRSSSLVTDCDCLARPLS